VELTANSTADHTYDKWVAHVSSVASGCDGINRFGSLCKSRASGM